MSGPWCPVCGKSVPETGMGWTFAPHDGCPGSGQPVKDVDHGFVTSDGVQPPWEVLGYKRPVCGIASPPDKHRATVWCQRSPNHEPPHQLFGGDGQVILEWMPALGLEERRQLLIDHIISQHGAQDHMAAAWPAYSNLVRDHELNHQPIRGVQSKNGAPDHQHLDEPWDRTT